MSTQSETHSFRIISLTKGHQPLGIGLILPTWQNVTVGAAVKHWKFTQIKGDIYHLSVTGHPYTGVENQKIVASLEPAHELEWRIIYREFHDAYTIALAKDSTRVWTVPHVLSGNHAVELQSIIMSEPSVPPMFSPSQLFHLVSDD